MFHRRSSSDHDVVAAAQRRLAALTAQHARVGPAIESEQGVLEDGGGDESRPAESHPAARHVGSRRGELGRWGVDAQHVTVAALLIVALVVAVAWWALRSVPSAEPVQLSSQRVLPAGPTADSPSATTAQLPSPSPANGAGVVSGTAAESTRLVVDVAGKVRHPGIVELPAGSRVVDAIAAAGGAKPGVSLTSLNLARLLVDGEQIVVGIEVPALGGAAPSGDGSSGSTASNSIAPVNLNTATAEQLETLPDVGPVTAQAILQWRADNGRFASVDDLLDVSGIGDATLADIRPFVYV